MTKLLATLYKITNNVNGKIYIGMTVKSLEHRFNRHCSPYSNCPHIKNAIQKYGQENFTIVALVKGSPEYIADMEQKAIEVYESYKHHIGYNLMRTRQHVPDDYDWYSRIGKSCYVMGFWFPTKKLAMDKLGIGKIMLERYLEYDGESLSLGITKDEIAKVDRKSRRKAYLDSYVYFLGFWYPSVGRAAKVNNVGEETVRKAHEMGLETSLEPVFAIGREAKVKANKARHSKEITVNGVTYPSYTEACKHLPISQPTLRKVVEMGFSTIEEYQTYAKQEKAKKQREIADKKMLDGSYHNSKRCIINGVEYPSLYAAARSPEINLEPATLRYQVKTGKVSYIEIKED